MTTDDAKPSAKKTEREIHDEVLAWLTAQAQSQTVAVLAAQDDVLATFTKAHAEDAASFKFECRRWGDFLALMVERGGAKVMHALDIGAGSVQLIAGHAPDRLGEVPFHFSVERDPEPERQRGCTVFGGGGNTSHRHGLSWPDKGKYVVRPTVAQVWPRSAAIELDRKADGSGGGGYYSEPPSYIRFTVPTGARPAEDDRLRFERAGATLRTPADHGEAAYAAILAELKRGSDK